MGMGYDLGMRRLETDGLMGGWVDGWMDGWMDGWKEGRVYR